jgi:hypothetical protein
VPFLSHTLFMSLPRNDDHTVSIQDLAEFLHTMLLKTKAWARASAHDHDHDGFLSYTDISEMVDDIARALSVGWE